ncbi:endonuclease MutS2 [Geopsychrobacter electrodiphilus]|uniref:endonuclease MutS2 n=1 Tax=Geopsychrobacter electrodiphilus TaxID=225196 RepID=UPI00036C6B75|nr:endonuclease MutS2 [Geopsychrobacter electrodiphilus]
MEIVTSTLVRLEFDAVRGLLAKRTASAPGRLLAEQLVPLESHQAVLLALEEVGEAQHLLADGTPPLANNAVLSSTLKRSAASGSLLGAEQLQQVRDAIEAAGRCRNWADPLEVESRLACLCLELDPLSGLLRRLQLSIGARGEILDSASFELGDIRRELRQLRGQIKQQLTRLLAGSEVAGCFQDELITVRNGRYVVPLKADYRGRIKGLVHDESASGQTLYFEPELVLAGNSRLQQLLQEEQREERRILLQLTDLVRQYRTELARNEELLARLDLRFATARLAGEYNGQIPLLVDEPLIDLREARHPLLMVGTGEELEPVRAIPINLCLLPPAQTLVISGPNTGGKSVALKSFGLLLLMVRAGLPIPCAEGSRLSLFDALFVDIGDQQSISEQLSTFSGHLTRLKEILRQAGPNALVLLDEAGTGTDPAEGAALVIAALEMLQQAGAHTVLTTHLGQLKNWAAETPGVENAAVDIDPDTLAPKYRLNYGVPGASSAMATASRLGLPTPLLDRAQQLLGEQPQQGNELILSLNRRQQELDALHQQIELERVDARRLWLMRRDQLEKLQQHKSRVHAQAVQQAEGLIAETTRQLRRLKRDADIGTSAKAQVAVAGKLDEVRQQLAPFRPLQKPRRTSGQAPEVGELVRVIPLDLTAEVVKIQGKDVELQISGKRIRQPLAQVEALTPRRFARRSERQATSVSRPAVSESQAMRLVLVGQRIEPALQALERFLDDALLASLEQIEIVHGSGTGALRKAVREYLARQRFVTAFYAAAAEDGGEKITVAELGSG